jgi:hypothetical protein
LLLFQFIAAGVSTTPVVLVAKFAAGVVDNGTMTCEYLRTLSKKIRNDPIVIFWSLREDDS